MCDVATRRMLIEIDINIGKHRSELWIVLQNKWGNELVRMERSSALEGGWMDAFLRKYSALSSVT